jgi:hypothetical protein
LPEAHCLPMSPHTCCLPISSVNTAERGRERQALVRGKAGSLRLYRRKVSYSRSWTGSGLRVKVGEGVGKTGHPLDSLRFRLLPERAVGRIFRRRQVRPAAAGSPAWRVCSACRRWS